jgi:hypothetical protein
MRPAVPAVALLFLAACGGEATDASRSEAGPAPEAPAAPTAPASLVAADLDLPDFAPLYPGSEVTTSIVSEDARSRGGMVTYRTDASPEEVVAFHRRAAAALPGAAEAGEGATRSFGAGELDGERSVQVVATPSGGATSVQLSWSRPL